MKEQNAIYFPSLNGLRFIAASLVIIHHIEDIKYALKLPDDLDIHFYTVAGKLGVILFFVLSGFLITYLLLKEDETSSGISISKFYIRRILRIWPLYFLIVILSLFVFPHIPFFSFPDSPAALTTSHLLQKIILFVFFLPNLILYMFPVIPLAGQTWSIGTEEQFYLVWPVLMKKSKNKYWLMAGVIVFYLSMKAAIYSFPALQQVPYLMDFWDTFCIDCMAIGGLMALFAYNKNQTILKLLYNKYVQIITYGVTVVCILYGFSPPPFNYFFHYEFYSVLFGIIIINLATNPSSVISLEYKWLHYLGKISYGIYMYHPIAIVTAIKLLLLLHLYYDPILYPLSFGLTLLLAALSYQYFEKRFINYKHRFNQISNPDLTG